MNHSEISWKIIDKFFKDNKHILVKHHIDSYNNFFLQAFKKYLKIKILLDFLKK